MRDSYLSIYSDAQGEVTEKRSRFIGDLCPVASEAEALAFIERIKKMHPDARHHCYAFIAGSQPEIVRASDDGEPSQTAGLPMLQVLQGAGLHGVCLVVTRYFGGTLLGTGGLTRAYAAAAEEAVADAKIIKKIPAMISMLNIDYSFIGKLQAMFAKEGIVSLEETYTDKVSFKLLVPDDLRQRLAGIITEMTSGQVSVEEVEPVWFAVIDGKPELYDH